MNRKWISAIGFLLALVTAHSSAESDLLKNSENAKMCEVVKSLITEHRNGFKSLRGDRTDTQHVTIWKAKQHVVGNACEIWQSDRKDTFYVCTRSVPNQQVADEYYVNARKRLGACLGAQWVEAEVPRQTGGKKTTFSMKGMKTVIEIHAVRVDGVFRDQWTIYYLAGGAAMGL